MKILIFSLLVLVLAVLIAVLALVWTMPGLPSTIRTDTICLPDEHGTLTCGRTPDLLHDYLKRVTVDESDRHEQEVENRIKQYTKENGNHLKNIYDKFYWEMKPAAKVTGKRQPSMRKSDIGGKMMPIREWCHGRELYYTDGFIRYGVRYRNGRLVVPVSGTYYIYSFINFYQPCKYAEKPDTPDSSDRIEHGIFKFNILTERETEIASHIQPEMVSCNMYLNSYSSYVSTLAELKAGDELSVKVSNLTFLKYSRNNFFGLNLI